MSFKRMRNLIPPEGWAMIGLKPNLGGQAVSESPVFNRETIELTAREMAGLERWTHTIFPELRFDVALGLSLASKGLVRIIGWYADGDTRLGESCPDFLALTMDGVIDLRDPPGMRRVRAEIHVLAKPTPLGMNVIRRHEETIRGLLRPNRKTEPTLAV